MESEHRPLLYQVWRKIRSHSCCDEWSQFSIFYDWAIENGYEIGARIHRTDISRPYGPDNCVVRVPKLEADSTFTQQEQEWVDGWNNLVNRIRKSYGMPPLKGV